MSILADSAILKAIERKEIVIEPFDRECLGANSYDIHLGSDLLIPKGDYLDAKAEGYYTSYHIQPAGHVLKPGVLYLASTVEYTESRVCVPYLDGKCFEKGTQVWMYDNTLRAVEDVVVGDVVLGVHGRPLRVCATHAGLGDMFCVTQAHGMPYVVNSVHELVLRCGKGIENHKFESGSIVTVEVAEYNRLAANIRRHLYGFREQGMFSSTTVLPVAPYTLGLWLGDGTSVSAELTINNNDAEIFEYLRVEFPLAKFHQYKSGAMTVALSTHPRDAFVRPNSFLNFLRELKLINNKHIPPIYLVASVEDRLQLLAGLLDTDGSINNCSWEITTKYRALCSDLQQLAQSLGLSVSVISKWVEGSEYFRLGIFGDNISKIPSKLSRKHGRLKSARILNRADSRIEVTPVGVGAYYGFELEGRSVEDHMFFLRDFTVVHNSSIGRLGIQIHSTAGRGDIGFCGHWTMEISVVQSVKVYAGMPIGQLTWHTVEGGIERLYNENRNSSYAGGGRDYMPQPSRLWKKLQAQTAFLLLENVRRPCVICHEPNHPGMACAILEEMAKKMSVTVSPLDQCLSAGGIRPVKQEPIFCPTCKWCGTDVREGLIFCSGLSECFLKGTMPCEICGKPWYLCEVVSHH